MQGSDALLVPAAPGEAPQGLAATGDPIFSRVWNLLGLPCVNVPGLLGPSGLPIGLQLVGHPSGERRLLQVAKLLQAAIDEGGAATSTN
jgi:Asp-tRNA(Asn)/Glu-tRNA(Gln) amidotransferase A subunit family amidase